MFIQAFLPWISVATYSTLTVFSPVWLGKCSFNLDGAVKPVQKLIFCHQMSNQIETEAVDPPKLIEKVSKDLEKKEVIEEESKLFPAFDPNKVFVFNAPKKNVKSIRAKRKSSKGLNKTKMNPFLIILQPDGAAPANKPVFHNNTIFEKLACKL